MTNCELCVELRQSNVCELCVELCDKLQVVCRARRTFDALLGWQTPATMSYLGSRTICCVRL